MTCPISGNKLYRDRARTVLVLGGPLLQSLISLNNILSVKVIENVSP